MLTTVESLVEKEGHIKLCGIMYLRLVAVYLHGEFVSLYRKYIRKKDGFASLLVDWHTVCGRLACESLEARSCGLLLLKDIPDTECTRKIEVPYWNCFLYLFSKASLVSD